MCVNGLIIVDSNPFFPDGILSLFDLHIEMNSPRGILNLRVMGFCGADDSVHVEHLQLLSIHYPWIEWGVLFRPDLEGTPRYATSAWVDRLCKINEQTGGTMRLAGHLCGSRCQEVLDGDASFVSAMAAKGFGRFQVNATVANNVKIDTSNIEGVARNLKSCIESLPEVEWIFQLNAETQGIWVALCELCSRSSSGSSSPRTTPMPSSLSLEMPSESTSSLPHNLSCLFDASCGLGKLAATYQSPITVGTQDIPCGYAGGIAPENVLDVLRNVSRAAIGKPVWIDMESSLRVTVTDKQNSGKDCFSIEKCMGCIVAASNKFPQTLPVSRVSLLSI